MKKFKIKSSESKLWFWVYVHDTKKEMNQAAFDFDQTVDKGGGQLTSPEEDTLGWCHPYERIDSVTGKREIMNIGIIRLNKQNIWNEVVSHECIHAAIWIYRLEAQSRKFSLGKQVSWREEKFCRIYSQLFVEMTKKLYKYNIWS